MSWLLVRSLGQHARSEYCSQDVQMVSSAACHRAAGALALVRVDLELLHSMGRLLNGIGSLEGPGQCPRFCLASGGKH